MNFLWTAPFLFVLGLTVAAHAHDGECDPLFLPSPAEYRIDHDRMITLHQEFHADYLTNLDNPKSTREKLTFSAASELVPTKILGYGVQAVTIQVRYQGKDYALKLIKKHDDEKIEREHGNWSTPWPLIPVLMQKLLGNLGMAPQLVGILTDKQMTTFKSKYEHLLKRMTYREGGDDVAIVRDRFDRINTAILMDLVDANSLKGLGWARERGEPPKTRPLSPTERQQLLAQAEHYFDVLTQLRILAQDPDGTITPRRGFQFIDPEKFYYNADLSSLGRPYERVPDAFFAQYRQLILGLIEALP